MSGMSEFYLHAEDEDCERAIFLQGAYSFLDHAYCGLRPAACMS